MPDRGFESLPLRQFLSFLLLRLIQAQLKVTWRGILAEYGLTVNPWALLARDHGGGERYQILELDQIVRIFRQAQKTTTPGLEPGFWPAAIQMGLYTGLREGDIAQLEWNELQVAQGNWSTEAVVRGTYNHSKLEQARAAAAKVAAAMPEVKW